MPSISLKGGSVLDQLKNMAEGDYSHHRESKNLNSFFSELNRISDAFDKVIENNQKIDLRLLFKLGFKIDEQAPERYTKEYEFNPTNGIMEKAFKISPLKCTITISTREMANRNESGFFRRGDEFSRIDIAYRIDQFCIDRYNSAVDMFKMGGDTYLAELNKSKNGIKYATCKQAYRSIFLHELTHWLDAVFDHGIFSRNNKKDGGYLDDWLFYEHETNAIIHQIKLIKRSLPEKLWNKLSIIDLMIMLRIPKIFIKKALLNYIEGYTRRVGVIRGIDDIKLSLIKKKLGKDLISSSGKDWISRVAQELKDHRIFGKMMLKGIDLDYYALNEEFLYSRDSYLEYYLMMTRHPQKYIEHVDFYRDSK